MTNISASIDLGSNTFQLLIAEIHENQNLKVIMEESFVAKLFFDQNQKNQISETAIQRALLAIQEIQNRCKKFALHSVHVAATSALRDAENGTELAKLCFEKLAQIPAKHHHLEVITGDIEAQYIAQAQLFWLKSHLKSPFLIVDIGGGSVEFAFFDTYQNLTVKSLALGVARLIHQFQISFENSLTQLHTNTLKNYILEELKFLKSHFNSQSHIQLIGVSGAFETNAELLHIPTSNKFATYTTPDFMKLHLDLLHSSPEDRKKNNLIPEVRKDMILIANIIIECVLKTIDIQKIIYSGYDLRYGLLLSNESK